MIDEDPRCKLSFLTGEIELKPLVYTVTSTTTGRWWWRRTWYSIKCEETGVTVSQVDKMSLDFFLSISGTKNVVFVLGGKK